MKTGRTLVELAQELLDQQESKRDFHVKNTSLNMLPTGQFRLETKDAEILMPATEHAHGQVASKLNVPKVYYDRMRHNSPTLLAQNVNHWWVNLKIPA